MGEVDGFVFFDDVVEETAVEEVEHLVVLKPAPCADCIPVVTKVEVLVPSFDGSVGGGNYTGVPRFRPGC